MIITHKLHEVMALSDRVAVLRKGKYIGTVHTADTDPQKLTEMMVGRAVSLNIDRPEAKYRDLRLEVKGLTCRCLLYTSGVNGEKQHFGALKQSFSTQ